MSMDDSDRDMTMSPAQDGAGASQQPRRRRSANLDQLGATGKRQRLVFSDIQKRTLQAIFKETQRPSREMQHTIAEHLQLDLSTVANFFMNARRRSRNGQQLAMNDEPSPFQQIRPITPPPPEEPSAVQRPLKGRPPRTPSALYNYTPRAHPVGHGDEPEHDSIDRTVNHVVQQQQHASYGETTL